MRRYKIVVYVPKEHGEALRQAMGEAGAGVIGEYSFCTFTSSGVGRFKPSKAAHPSAGEVGKLNALQEERIETICAPEALERVLHAIRKAHPYEEPAIDVYPLQDI
jgi:hypothetical protein